MNKEDQEELTIAVSACLLGEACRYDGASKSSAAVGALKDIKGIKFVYVCPEVQGGLATPRPPAEIQCSNDARRVMNRAGEDVTVAFEKGASEALRTAQSEGARLAIFKAKSPSCGSGKLYDGTFTGTITEGWGVTAGLFVKKNIVVIDETDAENIVSLAKKRADEVGGSWRETAFSLLKQFSRLSENERIDSSENNNENTAFKVDANTTHGSAVPAGASAEMLPSATFEKALGHFRTITKHKLEVGKLCFKVGLVKQGLTHDLSKYSPTEFAMGARFYQGYRSPNAAEREFRGYTSAWLHHKGRNRHHFEYWLDLSDDPGMRLKPAPMPVRYVVEMFCDRIAASKTYKGAAYKNSDPWDYYERGRAYIIMHPRTRALLEQLLATLAEQGEDAALCRAREMLREGQ